MAIAGVNSFASSLGDGLAREGRTILGGDLAFTLIHREADADGARLPRRSRAASPLPPPCARWRARAEDGAHRAGGDQGGRRRLSAVRRGSARSGDARSPMHSRNATASTAPPPNPLLLARLDLKPGARITIGNATIEIRAALTVRARPAVGGRLRLRPAADDQPGGAARHRAHSAGHRRCAGTIGCACPTTMPATPPCTRVSTPPAAQVPDAGWEVRSRNNASPALERNIERFTQYLTLVGLTALLVGGVGVANAIRGHLDRKRDTIATMKSLGATGGGVFAIYLTQAMALALIGAMPGLDPRRRAAVPDRLGLRRDPAAAARAGAASRRPRAGVALRPPHRARLRDLAARPRARCLGLGAVPRRGGAGAPLAAHDLRGADGAGGRGAGGAGGEARLRPAHRRDLRGGRRRRVRLAAAGRERC